MARRTLTPRAAARLYVVVGGVAIAIAAGLAAAPQLLLHGASLADATVISLRGNTAQGWTPVVEFTEPNGGVVRWSGAARHGPPVYEPGARLHVLYLPDKPGAITIAGFWQIYAPAIAAGVFGALFLGLGLLGLRATLRLPP
jgi:hypothetical protein